MDAFFRPDDDFLGTKGLIFIGEKLLVYRRDEKAPEFPLYIDVAGGGVEGSETPFQTFQREVKEEFGLVITNKDITYAKRYPSIKVNGRFGWYAVAKLPANQESNIVFGDEGIEYMLMSPDEFLKRADVWPIYQQRAAEYLRSSLQ